MGLTCACGGELMVLELEPLPNQGPAALGLLLSCGTNPAPRRFPEPTPNRGRRPVPYSLRGASVALRPTPDAPGQARARGSVAALPVIVARPLGANSPQGPEVDQSVGFRSQGAGAIALGAPGIGGRWQSKKCQSESMLN